MMLAANPLKLRACLTSVAVLLGAAACTSGEGDRADTAVVLETAAAHTVPADSAAVTPPAASAPVPSATTPPPPAKTADTSSRLAGKAAAPRGTTKTADTARRAPARAAATVPPARLDSTPARRDTTPTPTPPPAQTTTATQQPAQGGDNLAVSQAEYNGWKTFAVNCTRCHGEDAIGSALAPSLVKSLQTLDHDAYVQTVTDGRPEKGMPAWKDILTPQKIEEMYAYLKARSSGRLAPGRPHVRAND